MSLNKTTTITNYFDFKEAKLVPFNFDLSEEQIKDIVRICNSKLVYHFLFEERLKNKPYTIEDAKKFNEMAKKGWKDNTSFIYLLLDDDFVVGAIDIKSNSKESSEIGYWADPEREGYITNTLLELITLAREDGFKKLYSKVELINDKSQRVLERVGFIQLETLKEKGKEYFKYEYSLI